MVHDTENNIILSVDGGFRMKAMLIYIRET
jgi:hypothetical protein